MYPKPYIEPRCHLSRERYHPIAIRPLRISVLYRVTLLDTPLPIKNPHGFADIDQILTTEALGDQMLTDRAARFDILRPIIINKAITLPRRRSTTHVIVLFKQGYFISGVLQRMSRGKSTASRAYNCDGGHLTTAPTCFSSNSLSTNTNEPASLPRSSSKTRSHCHP